MTPSRLYFKHFSLVELLIVIAVLAILISLLSPSLKKGLETAHQMACMKNQQQLGSGFIFYAEDHNGDLPYAREDHEGYTWEYALRGYFAEPMERLNAWGQFDGLDTFVDDERLDILKCPSSEIPDYINAFGEANRATASYVMPSSSQDPPLYSSTFSSDGSAVSVNLDTLLTTDVILITEMEIENAPWYAGFQGYGNFINIWFLVYRRYIPIQDVLYHPNVHHLGTNNSTTNNTSLLHPQQQVNFLFVDGHVESNIPQEPEIISAWTLDPND